MMCYIYYNDIHAISVACVIDSEIQGDKAVYNMLYHEIHGIIHNASVIDTDI